VSYTGFPYPEGSPIFPSGAEVQNCLESYAYNFDFLPHIKLQTKVLKIVRNHDDTKWTLQLRDRNGSETTDDFEKVAICCGE
jgi:dimethylaniline monooxygenase (N-oxide forming)